MSTRSGSPARVILSMFAVSALVAISFIAAIVLFIASHPTSGLIALSIAGIGFIGLFVALQIAIKRESAVTVHTMELATV